MRQSRTGARASVADERYRAHRAVRRLLELLAAERPLVIVLDDVHWSDDASIELLAALLRREADAPVLVAAGFRPGQASPALAAALAAPSVRRLVLGPLDEAQAIELLGAVDAGDRRLDLSRRRRQSVLPRAAAPLPRGRPRSPSDGARATSRSRASRYRPPSRPRSPGSWRRSRRSSWCCSGLRRSPASRSSPTSRPRSPSFTERRRSTPWTRSSSSTSSARRRCRAASSSATRSCAARSTRRLRPAGGWPPTRGRRRASQRKERRRPSRHTTSSSTRLGATRRRSRSCSTPGRPLRHGLRRRRHAGSRRRWSCSRRRTTGVWTSTSPSRRRSAPSASSIARGRPCSRRSSSCRPTRRRGGSS